MTQGPAEAILSSASFCALYAISSTGAYWSIAFSAFSLVFALMYFPPMDQKYLDELRQKYIKNPPEGMTPKLVRNMTDSDLFDMHYFLTEDDEFGDDEFEEGFYIDLF